MEFITEYKPIFVVLHALSAAVGLGAVIVTDTLFFRFLKDFKISVKEDDTLRTLSKVVWVVIGLLFVTGLILFLTAAEGYLEKSKFIAKIIIFGVIVVNGFILNWLIAPRLRKIAFGPLSAKLPLGLKLIRRIAFASGAISLISWFVVFILGSIRSIPVTVGQALLGYLALVILVIIGSQIYAFWMKHPRNDHK